MPLVCNDTAGRSGISGVSNRRQSQRQVIARIGLDGRNGYFDTDTVPGALHTYGVTAVDANGDVVAVGGPQQVRWPTAD